MSYISDSHMETILAPREQVAISADTDSCHNWGVEGSYRHVVEKVRDVAK